MRKSFFPLILSLLAVSLSGACVTDDSPENVVRLAGQRIYENDVWGFVSLLVGNARDNYGSAAGLARLRERLPDDPGKVNVKPAVASAAEATIPGAQVYNVDVIKPRTAGSDGTLIFVRVDCTPPQHAGDSRHCRISRAFEQLGER